MRINCISFAVKPLLLIAVVPNNISPSKEKIYTKTYLFYLFERERDSMHEQGEVQREREGEVDSLLSTEPDMVLDPRTPRS